MKPDDLTTTRDRLRCGCVLSTDAEGHSWFEHHCLRHRRDCDELGLNDDQRAALTGFSGRAVRALAHLREAWCGADPQNAAHVARAIHELTQCHSLCEIPASCASVLQHGLDEGRAAQLIRAVHNAGRRPCP